MHFDRPPVLRTQINAKGEAVHLDSPRMKFAIKHAGVSLPEIYPQVSSSMVPSPWMWCQSIVRALYIPIAYVRGLFGRWLRTGGG